MAPRLKFALVYFEDVQAVEIFKANLFTDGKGLTESDSGLVREVLVDEVTNDPLVKRDGKILVIGKCKQIKIPL